MENQEIKTHLTTCMSQLQDHQKTLADLTMSLAAVIETLKSQNPHFEGAYETAYEALENGQTAHERDAIVQRIENVILRLESK